jgi:uncharacterized protein
LNQIHLNHNRFYNRFLSATAAMLCLLAFISCAEQVSSLKPSGAINDFASILSPSLVSSLENFSISVHEKTGVSLVVVTLPSLDGAGIDETANQIYAKWGIGSKDRDEGVLLLIAVNDRMIRIEPGYGSEGYITDALSSDIIRNTATPFLRENKWDDGVASAFSAIAEIVAKEKQVPIDEIAGYARYAGRQIPHTEISINPIQAIIIIVILIVLLSTRTGRTLLFFMILSSMRGSGRSYGGGGFGGGLSKGGGFGGFGGGMSGGGGASGRF